MKQTKTLDEHAHILIQDWAANQVAQRIIAKKLTALGYVNKKGNPFTQTTISSLLRKKAFAAKIAPAIQAQPVIKESVDPRPHLSNIDSIIRAEIPEFLRTMLVKLYVQNFTSVSARAD